MLDNVYIKINVNGQTFKGSGPSYSVAISSPSRQSIAIRPASAINLKFATRPSPSFGALVGDPTDNEDLVEYITEQISAAVPNVGAYKVPYGDPDTGVLTSSDNLKFVNGGLVVTNTVQDKLVAQFGGVQIYDNYNNFPARSGIVVGGLFIQSAPNVATISDNIGSGINYVTTSRHYFQGTAIFNDGTTITGGLILPTNNNAELQFTGSGVANIQHTTLGADMTIGVSNANLYFTTDNFSTYALQIGINNEVIFAVANGGGFSLGSMTYGQSVNLYAGTAGYSPGIKFIAETAGGIQSGIVEFYTSRYGPGDMALKLKGRTVQISNSEYADNAAAIAAGLDINTVYRTGDLLKIVH